MEVIKGIPVSSGVVIGRACVLHDVVERVPYATVDKSAIDKELQRLDLALQHAVTSLAIQRDRAAEKLGAEPAKIFEFHLGLLHDRSLIDPIRSRIKTEQVTAAFAVTEAFRALANQFRTMDSEVFRQKASDIIDLDRRILSSLVGRDEDCLANLREPSIVIAHELTPTQAASMDNDMVIGFATDAGGRTSHTSIVAGSLGIPAVVGCQRVTLYVNDGDELIIDGHAGVVIVRPDAATLEQYRLDVERQNIFKLGLRELATLDAVTLDGTRIQLLGNIEFPYEIDAVLDNGGEGVGLYRTEFLYLTSPTPPTEEDHFQAYADSIRRLNGRPLTIRTLDLGADKYTQERAEEPERNPFLGCRSIRYCLQNLPIFETQLRAILRASVLGPIKVMIPLVTTPMELRQTRMILNDVMEECDDQGIEYDRKLRLGVMIEVPSAALMAPILAREASFFSIGTNDLIQYTLAVDRGNERVANLYTAASPAVLQLIKTVIRAAKRGHIDVSLCGEIASEVTYTMLLIGMGLRTLSLVPWQIPHIKRVIRAVDIQTCERLARRVGSFDSERQVLNCLREEVQKVLPEMDVGWSGA